MKFYRYEYCTTSNYGRVMDGKIKTSRLRPTVRVICNEYELVKETPKGYWITTEYYIYNKWVSKTSKKRFAYSTKEEALTNFRLRSEKYLSILEPRVRDLKDALRQINNFKIDE